MDYVRPTRLLLVLCLGLAACAAIGCSSSESDERGAAGPAPVWNPNAAPPADSSTSQPADESPVGPVDVQLGVPGEPAPLAPDAADQAQPAIPVAAPSAEPAPPAVEAEPSPPMGAQALPQVPAEPPSASPAERSPLPLRPNPLRQDPPTDASGSAPAQPAAVALAAAPPGKCPPLRNRPRPKNSSKANPLPFNPVKENGALFTGWPKPKLALVLTGRQDGYLEPCGCAGMERMKGGLSRRHFLFRQLREERGWPVAGFDAGGFIKDTGYGLQAELKFHTTVEALRTMGYSGVAFGKNDLHLQTGEVLADAATVPGQPALFVSANVGLFGLTSGMTALSEVYEVGGVKIGATSVVGQSWLRDINNQDVDTEAPAAALAKLVPELEARCDLLILLAHATVEESAELAKKFPQFDVVVTAGGPPEPALGPTWLQARDRLLVEVGQKAEYAVVLGLFDTPGERFRYQRVPLDSRFPASPEMTLLMANYQERLKDEGLPGLGIRPSPHPKREINGAFVGSQECESCHEPSYKVWKKSAHAAAWPTLVCLDPPRNFDPECISCHVVGWHPTSYFPYETGFLNEADTPKLVDVGCESCHGPGENHVKAELQDQPQLAARLGVTGTEALREKLRQAMVITKEESERQHCMSCHDGDNSPDFDFATYWPLVEHNED